MSTLLERRELCADRILCERVAQALLESGKQCAVDTLIAKLVCGSSVLGNNAEESVKLSTTAITDAEIVTAVALLP